MRRTLVAALTALLVLVGFAILWTFPPAASAFGLFDRPSATGSMTDQARAVGEFHKIDVRGSTDVRVSVGGAQSVVVVAPAGIADLIETAAADGTLTVSTKRTYWTPGHTVVRISVPTLDAIAIDGSADATVEGIHGPAFDVTLRGSGDLTASGAAGRLTYDCDGSGDARLRDLAVRDAVVRIRGSGDAHLAVSQTLDAEIFGSGDITYEGSARLVNEVIRGSGSVSRG